MNQPLIPLLSSGRTGPFVSATSTSPLGRTYSHRGCSSRVANADIEVPLTVSGFCPAGQPFAGATLTVGMSDGLGGGNSGDGPIPSATDKRALGPQATTTAEASTADRRMSLNTCTATLQRLPRPGIGKNQRKVL